MWTCKIKLDSAGGVAGRLCHKYGINAEGYPFSTVVNDGRALVNFVLFLFCDKEKADVFFKEFEKSEGVINSWMKDGYILGQIDYGFGVAKMFRYNIVHLEPIKLSAEGYEIWTIAAWDKMELTKFCKVLEEIYGSLHINIKEKSISNVSVLAVHPELTDNQRRAVGLAVENNYYDIPRGISLEELAKLMGVSYSTYQAHLRKAEKKLLPFFFRHSV